MTKVKKTHFKPRHYCDKNDRANYEPHSHKNQRRIIKRTHFKPRNYDYKNDIKEKIQQGSSKHLRGKIEFQSLDEAITTATSSCEMNARKQASIGYAEFLKDFKKFECDDTGMPIGLIFNKATEKEIAKSRPHRVERNDLTVVTPYMRLFPIDLKSFPIDMLPEDIFQQHWNRRVNYGFSYIAAKSDHVWDAEQYEKNVMKKGYTALAKDGRRILGCNNPAKDVEEDSHDQLFDDLGKFKKGRSAKAMEKAMESKKSPSTFKIDFSEEEQLKGFHDWLKTQIPIAQPILKHKPFWDEQNRNKAKKILPPVRFSFVVPGFVHGFVDIIYNQSGFSAELKSIMLKQGQKYLMEQAKGEPKKKKEKNKRI